MTLGRRDPLKLNYKFIRLSFHASSHMLLYLFLVQRNNMTFRSQLYNNLPGTLGLHEGTTLLYTVLIMKHTDLLFKCII